MTPAWADHGVGLRSATLSPLTEALIWAGVAFVLGVVVVAIVSVLTRRRSPSQ